jgi:hypothetical protein
MSATSLRGLDVWSQIGEQRPHSLQEKADLVVCRAPPDERLSLLQIT